jgi:hypothetical protein
MIYKTCSKKILFIEVILILPIFFLNVSAQDSQDTHVKLDSPENESEFHTVVTFMMTMIVLSWFGCFYVFYRTYKQWILDNKSLKMIHKLPLYTALSGKLIFTIMSSTCGIETLFLSGDLSGKI